MKRHVVLLLGPSREAISGVTTHLNALFGSRLLSDPALARRLGAAARESVVRDHAPSQAVERLGRLYASLGQHPA